MSFKKLNIGENHVFIIAELSANHGSDIEVAKATIRAAKRCGADAIKFQTYTADTITIESSKEDFIVGGGTNWDGRTLHDLYREAHTPWEWHEELFRVAKEEGLICFSSPFDPIAAKEAERVGIEVAIINGSRTDALKDYLERKEFVGTLIHS